MEGICNCKAVKVTVNDADLFSRPRSSICHCQNCRKTSGSVYGVNLIIESDKVSISGEENLSEYKDFDTTSGNPVSRYFCKTCGNSIKSMTTLLPGKTILKLGNFPKIPAPESEGFVAHRQEWLQPQAGCTQYQ
ncbi:putative glutathione-dependent formaldehyde-activating enzyme [Lachnellula occidentalis]|uniref:Putative glutathione-dependent formaldehyde-activating enzyme n=1 Tax=Lachnellula occidentalis TaxID=215460 RepID=A0A8H8UAP0_9HELO|nr:putative glutathione-dependent formaldehyde-activating enzyme [Lachnellula occidentalis]